ncbi:hypothetical protein [Bifidobacterium vespertilionis]|uniref:Uncharacterized protein n=1 Tax=Bifidobacterium vespertilionis TaxID=2562524 RepID=A0A5J5E549_9BIFI|nr:hypothetical protein [Bifidobacterium vespertilionis]KAA8820182.1 hypothetical protein EMO90_07050 [Bifidobacterium vespertilionis]KAA8823893.1 hypothetical protein EM848_03600 [Bifidobacterium vespertilionis]
MKRIHISMSGMRSTMAGMKSIVGKAFSRPVSRPPIGWPWRVLTAASFIPVLVDSLYSLPMLNRDGAAVLLLVAFVAACMLALWRPGISSVMLAALYTASCMTPSNVSVLVLAPTAMGVVCLAREWGVAGFASATVCSGAALIKALSVHGDVIYGYGSNNGRMTGFPNMSITAGSGGLYWESTIGTCAILLMCAFAGVTWACKIDMDAVERDREALRRRLVNIGLADQLHNSLCNDLVYIVYSASHALEREKEGRGAQYDLCQIKETARSALGKTRTVISKLESDETAKTRDTQTSAINISASQSKSLDITPLIEEYDQRLRRLGFQGGTVAPPNLRFPVDPELGCVLHETITEIYTNILKYADPQGGYVVSVQVDNDSLRISAANTIRDDPDPQLSQGTGMQRCKMAVESLGGQFLSSRQYGHWNCAVTIPCGTPSPA